jgi:membrane protein required for beta-lactamase induction
MQALDSLQRGIPVAVAVVSTELVGRGDAVLFAWAPGSTLTKPLNQFSARRGERDSLFRLAVPVQH